MLNGFFPAAQDFAWRMIYRLAFPLAQLWWRIRRDPHEGALVAVRVGADLLLLRSSYRRAWNFPGGGVRPPESPEDSARRELQEETGITASRLRLSGTVRGFWEGRRDTVHIFELSLDALPPIKVDNREIVEARLFPPEAVARLKLTGPVAAYLAGEARVE